MEGFFSAAGARGRRGAERMREFMDEVEREQEMEAEVLCTVSRVSSLPPPLFSAGKRSEDVGFEPGIQVYQSLLLPPLHPPTLLLAFQSIHSNHMRTRKTPYLVPKPERHISSMRMQARVRLDPILQIIFHIG